LQTFLNPLSLNILFLDFVGQDIKLPYNILSYNRVFLSK